MELGKDQTVVYEPQNFDLDMGELVCFWEGDEILGLVLEDEGQQLVVVLVDLCLHSLFVFVLNESDVGVFTSSDGHRKQEQTGNCVRHLV